MIRDRIASGTLDAALWILGITDLAPATGLVNVDRTPVGLMDEAAATTRQRRSFDPTATEWLYLGGVADALAFALGDESPFWWVPLPQVLRVGPPRRDEYGREVDRHDLR